MNRNGIESQVHADSELNLKEMIRLTLIYRNHLILIFLAVMMFTLFNTLTTQPIFEATTVVMIKESQTNPSSFVFDFGVRTSKQRLQNEVEILNSYNLHDKVVQGLIEEGSADRLALFGTSYISRRYRLTDYLLNRITNVDKSKTDPKSISYSERISVVEKLRRSIGIQVMRDTDVLKISVDSPDSSEAVFLANKLARVYRELDMAGGQGELHYVLTFLDSQISKYEYRLEDVENRLREFQSKSNVFSLDGSAELLLRELTEYESIYYTNVAELEVTKERIKYLEAQLSDREKQLMEEMNNTNNPMVIALRARIAELEAQKIQQMIDEGWSESSLQAKDFDRRIKEMKTSLAELTQKLVLSGWKEDDPFAASQQIIGKIIEQEVEQYSASSRAKEYKLLVDEISERLNELPAKILQYARMERELKLNENLYLTMKQKYEESRITEAGQLGKVRILDPALIAYKIKPQIRINLVLGLLIGLALAAIYVTLREFLDSSVKSVETLEKKGLTILGIIPDMNTDKIDKPAGKPSKGGDKFRRRLITHENPKSPISESYRALRTNVSYSNVDKEIKSLLISSPQPGEGKSTTTANLAIAYAQLGKKTLLIDADLRKSVQHNVFNVNRGSGLTEFLVDEVKDIEFVIQRTEIPNLHILSAGRVPPNPSELLGSDKMNNLVQKLESMFDMVLLDSPPIIAVTDASMISKEIDAVAVVIKTGQTEKSAVDRSLEVLKNVRAPLIGVIMNGVSQHSLAGKYSYYYSYYEYYRSAEGTE